LPSWIEFHDSTLTRINRTDQQCQLVLDAYVHRWEARGDEWTGTGLMQVVHIIVGDPFGPLASTPVLPALISDGRIRAGDATYDLVPLPFEASSDVDLWLQIDTIGTVAITGHGVRVEAVGEGRYVEDLPAEWRPMNGRDDR
jgi:hypothetical protein